MITETLENQVMTVQTKKCSQCKHTKTAAEFVKNKNCCKKCHIKNAVIYRAKYKSQIALRAFARSDQQKLDALTALCGGNPPFCECCGETNINKLSIDHVNKDGIIHKNTIGGGCHLYSWLKNHESELQLRILCCNCNFSLGSYGYCPHSGCISSFSEEQMLNFSQTKKYTRRIKIECIHHYGGVCSACSESILEFLTIDHINDDGAADRKEYPRLYRKIRRENYPQNKYQVLCMSCNNEKELLRRRNLALAKYA